MSETKTKKYLSVCIVWLFVLSAFGSMGNLMTNDATSDGLIDNLIDEIVDDTTLAGDISSKIDPALGEFMKEGTKGMTKVIVATTDTAQLATALAKYEYKGLLGTKNTGDENMLMTHVLDVPLNSLDEIAGLSGVYGVYAYPDTSLDMTNPEEKNLFANGNDNGNSPASLYDSKQHYAQDAWVAGYIGTGSNVAIPEGGIDFGHPDLQGTQARVPATLKAIGETILEAVGGENETSLSSGGIMPGTFAIYVNGTAITSGTDYTLDLDTGIIAFTPALELGDIVTADYQFNSPYAGWPIVFDYNSMSTYLDTGETTDTWYVSTNETATVYSTPNNPELDIEVPVIKELTFSSDSAEVKLSTKLSHGSVKIGSIVVYADGVEVPGAAYSVNYDLGEISFSPSILVNKIEVSYIYFTWDNVPDSQRIVLKESNGYIPTSVGGAESYTVTGLDANTNYLFNIVATDEANNHGDFSNNPDAMTNEDTTAPDQITDFMATDGVIHGTVDLSWTATGDDADVGTATNYVIKYSEDPITNWVCFDYLADEYVQTWMPKDANLVETYTLTGLDIGTDYYFAIVAVDEAGNAGEVSNTDNAAVTDDIIAPARIDPTAYPGANSTQVYLEWTAITDTDSYELRYSTSDITNDTEFQAATVYADSLNWNPKSVGSTENYTLMMPLSGTTYYFSIIAIDIAGNMGAISNPNGSAVSRASDTIKPAQITDLNVETGPDHGTVYLNFTAPGDDGMVGWAQEYIVKYYTSTIDETNWDTIPDTVSDYGVSGTYSRDFSVDAPLKGGSFQSLIIGTTDGAVWSAPPAGIDYYFAIQADDGDNNASVSNCDNAIVQNDIIGPAVTTLNVGQSDNHGQIMLDWISPGDDGMVGSVKNYEIRYDTAPVTDATWGSTPVSQRASIVQSNFEATFGFVPVGGDHVYLNFSGAGFDEGVKYFFALIAKDEMSMNNPLVSNSPNGTARVDDVAPDAISLTATATSRDGTVDLTWAAPGDDGNVGTVTKYEIRYVKAHYQNDFVDADIESIGTINPTVIKTAYTVTGIDSVSGVYRLGTLMDENLATYVNNYSGQIFNYSKVLLVDSTIDSVYDTVYVDLDYDQDFTDEKACVMGDEISWRDMDGNGLADRSGGMIYYISQASVVTDEALTLDTGTTAVLGNVGVMNNSWEVHIDGLLVDESGNYTVDYQNSEEVVITFSSNQTGNAITISYEYDGLPIPYSERLAERSGVDNVIPLNGEMVAMYGEYALDLTAGTSRASAVAGQGLLNHRNDINVKPCLGISPDAKIIGITDPMYDGMIFAIEGYDGIPGTGDEADIYSSSLATSAYEAGGDFTSRYVDWLATEYGDGKTIFTATSGGAGSGYGTVSSPGSAPGVITAGLSTDFFYRIVEEQDSGPNPSYGDIITVSGRGPTMMGNPKPDVVASGAYFGFVSEPLWAEYDRGPNAVYTDTVNIWSGQALTSSNLAAAIAVIADAYDDTHTNPLDIETARSILMSGAEDIDYDVLSQGAGFVDVMESAKIASNMGGSVITPTSWVPGDYGGERYDAFAKLVSENTLPENLEQTFTIDNHDLSNSIDVDLMAGEILKAGEGIATITRDADYGHGWTILNETGFYTPDGELISEVDNSLWTSTDLVKITQYSTSSDYWLELYDWTDENGDGKLNGDLNAGPYDNPPVLFAERNRMSGAFIGGNVLECRVHDQSDNNRIHDGIAIWSRNMAALAEELDIFIKAEYYSRQTWDWVTLSDSALTIPAGASGTFTATLDSAKAIAEGVGSYEGAITSTTNVGKTTVIPMVINVAANNPNFEFGDKPAMNAVENFVGVDSFSFTSLNYTISNETHLSTSNATFNQTEFTLDHVPYYEVYGSLNNVTSVALDNVSYTYHNTYNITNEAVLENSATGGFTSVLLDHENIVPGTEVFYVYTYGAWYYLGAPGTLNGSVDDTWDNGWASFDYNTGIFTLDWDFEIGDYLYAWYSYNSTNYYNGTLPITNESWYDVNYDTGVITFNTSAAYELESGIPEGASVCVEYEYGVEYTNITKKTEFTLSHTNIIPDSFVTKEDGIALSKFNTVSREIILNNSREYLNQEILIAEDNSTTTANIDTFEAGYEIGPGTYTVFIDGELLIEGIDYTLNLQTGDILFGTTLDWGMVVTANYGTYAVGVTELTIANVNLYNSAKSITDSLGYQVYRNGNALTDGLQYFMAQIPVKDEISITAVGGESEFNLVNKGISTTTGNTLYLQNAGVWTTMIESASAGSPNYNINYNTGLVTLNGWTLGAGEIVHSYYDYSGTIEGKIKLNTFNEVKNEVVVDSASAGQDSFSVLYDNLNAIGNSAPNTFYYENTSGVFKLVKSDTDGVLNYKIDTVTGDITLNNWVMAPGDRVVAYYNYTGLKSGDFFEIDYSYGRYVFDPIVGQLDFLSAPQDGADVEVTYSYYDTNRLFDPAMMLSGYDGAGGKAGDWRFYYVDIPDQGTFTDSNTKLLINAEWWKGQTDIDAFAFGALTIVNPESGDTFTGDRYGPHGLQLNGGSTETATFFTSSGGPLEYSAPDIGAGLNVIALHNVHMNGTSDLEPIKGRVGTYSLDSDKISIVTNELAGTASVSGVSNIDLGGHFGGVAAGPSAPVSYKDLEVWEDDPDWSNYDTFEDQLASGNTTIEVTLKDCLIFDVHIYGHDNAPDLDLGVFYDENGDGKAEGEEGFAIGADFDADEQVKLIGPPDGNYIIIIYGFALKTIPAHFDIDITNVQGLGFGVEGEGVDLTPDNPDQWKSDTPLSAYTTSKLDLGYDLPSAKEGVTLQGALYIGPGEAPFTMLLPIDLRYDTIAPTSSGFGPGDGEVMRDSNPIITANFKDDFGELVPDSPKMIVDGVDVTPQASTNVPFVDDLDSTAPSPVQGFPLGTISYSSPSEMDDGIHSVEASIMDQAGNTFTESWTFLIDSGLPSLNVKTPETNTEYTTDDHYEISGLIETDATLDIFGVEVEHVNVANGEFSAYVILEDGKNMITISAIDLAGNKAEVRRTIVLDLNMPVFEGFVSEEGSRTNKDKITITGEVDESGYMTINGKEITVNSDGSFSTVVDLLEGENVLHLLFMDMAGNTIDDWLNITLDKTMPMITLDELPTEVHTDNFTFSAEIDEEELKIGGVLVNGKQVTVDSTRGISEFERTVFLSYGLNTIVIEVEDKAGNIVELRHTVELTPEESTNYGAIGMMIVLLIVGLVVGMFIAMMIWKDTPESEEYTPAQVTSIEDDELHGGDELDGDMTDDEYLPEDEIPQDIDGMEEPPIPEEGMSPEEIGDSIIDDEVPEDIDNMEEPPIPEEEMSPEEIGDSIIDDEIPEDSDVDISEDISSEMETENIETESDINAEPEITDEVEPDIETEEAIDSTLEAPEEDERVLRLRQAFEDGKISEELFEKNLAKLKEN